MYIPEKIQAHIRNKYYTVDATGMSAAGVYIFEDMVLKIQNNDEESRNEAKMLRWLNGKIPVPDIIEHISENERSYILMSKCGGKMACDPYYLDQPKRLAELLADALHRLWGIDSGDCPCQWPLQRRLAVAEENVVKNLVDIDDAQPNTFGPNGFRDPEHLLCWLIDNQPEQSNTISHGDFCLPNVFLSDNGVEGLIDLGKAGIADLWQDIALCVRSLDDNFSGRYTGRNRNGFQKEMLFEALGITPDMDRIRYYILLDELF